MCAYFVEAHGVMAPDSAKSRPRDVSTTYAGSATQAEGVFVRRGFLSPGAMVNVLGALDRLSAHWAGSEGLGLLGRGGTEQVRPDNLAVQAQLDQIRLTLAPAVLAWARSCGFRLSAAPYLTLFPVRMVGSLEAPAHQEPHTDSHATLPGPPICTNVFYARVTALNGGDIAVANALGDLDAATILHPTPNTIVSFAGERVHWVQPLHAGERVSVVINFY